MALAQHMLQCRGRRAMRPEVKQNLHAAISIRAAMGFGMILRTDL